MQNTHKQQAIDHQMALNEKDIELIGASWIPARADSIGAGVLLFKSLFTKFPDYLKLFNQFQDLDLEQIAENKRLVKHAVKVIETVTFVVDSIGNPTKAEALNEALVNLVRGHKKRSIGLNEFENLGIVLIDFICDLNNRYYAARLQANNNLVDHLTGPGREKFEAAKRGANSSTNSSQDSETMTCALDKIRASSSSSSSSEDLNLQSSIIESNSELMSGHDVDKYHEARFSNSCEAQRDDLAQNSETHIVRPDASQVVISWKKLYKIILDLVKEEEGA